MAKKLTIDDRLDRLVERHEALAQSVEMLVASQRRTEVEIEKMARLARAIFADHNKRITRLEKR